MSAKRLTLSVYPNAIADFHIQKTDRTKWAEKLHYHDYYQIYFITHGTLTHYYGNTAELMGKGDAFIIPPNQNHRIIMHEEAIFYSISFFLSFLGTNEKQDPLFNFLLSLDPAYANPLTVRPKVTFEPTLIPKIEGFLALMLSEFKSYNVENTENINIIFGLLTVLISLFSRTYYTLPSLRNNSPDYEAARKTVLLFIDKLKHNLIQPITLNDAIRETLMNKSLFCRVFLEITGLTFKQYLNRLRIYYATELILTTNNAISDIAEMSGYCNYTTFYRNFLFIAGISPVKYKALKNNLYE